MATSITQRQIPTREQIEQRAYELYLKRGGEDGNDLADWLAAEKELMPAPAEPKRTASRKGTSASAVS